MPVSVIVTGANGFVGQHVVKQLIEKNYTVIGTVRSAAKGDQLKTDLKSDNFSYEIVTHMDEEGAFDELLKRHREATVFLHTASPVSFAVTDLERDTLHPIINGTKYVLRSIKTYGSQIERLVITSSVGTIFNSTTTEPAEYNETNWNPITWEQSLQDPASALGGSKTFAERAAWDFVANEKPNFALTTVNPAFIFGPQAFDLGIKGTLNLSAEVTNSLLKLDVDSAIPPIAGPFADVRDVARAHLRGFEEESTKGQRLLLSAGNFTAQAILNIIHQYFPQYNKTLPVGDKTNEGFQNIPFKFDNSKTKKLLGFELVDLVQTTRDTVDQLNRVNN